MEISKEKIQDLAGKLLIELNEEELASTMEEFDVILKHMDLIDSIEGISEVNPLPYPFIIPAKMREDEAKESRTYEEILANCDDVLDNQIKVPKVVE